MRAALLIAVACLTCLSRVAAADAAELNSFKTQEGTAVITLTGKIAAGDSQLLTRIVQASNEANQPVVGILLNSHGGSLLEAAKLAGIIRHGKIATVLPRGAVCASACFIVFAGGNEKFASPDASLGVHGAHNEESGEEAGAATILMGRLARDLGVPPSIIGRMVVTPPDEMVWLALDDFRSMGVKITDNPSQPFNLPPIAQVPVQVDPSRGRVYTPPEDEPDFARELFSVPPEEREAVLDKFIYETLGIPLDLRAPAGTLGVAFPDSPDTGPGMPGRNPLRADPWAAFPDAEPVDLSEFGTPVEGGAPGDPTVLSANFDFRWLLGAAVLLLLLLAFVWRTLRSPAPLAHARHGGTSEAHFSEKERAELLGQGASTQWGRPFNLMFWIGWPSIIAIASLAGVLLSVAVVYLVINFGPTPASQDGTGLESTNPGGAGFGENLDDLFGSAEWFFGGIVLLILLVFVYWAIRSPVRSTHAASAGKIVGQRIILCSSCGNKNHLPQGLRHAACEGCGKPLAVRAGLLSDLSRVRWGMLFFVAVAIVGLTYLGPSLLATSGNRVSPRPNLPEIVPSTPAFSQPPVYIAHGLITVPAIPRVLC